MSASEDVRAARLAHLRPFRPGQSGNPGGRRGGSLVDEVRKILALPATPALAAKILGKRRAEQADLIEMTNMQLLAMVAVTLALRGNIRAMALVWSYVDGKPVERIETDVDVRHSVTVRSIREAIGLVGDA